MTQLTRHFAAAEFNCRDGQVVPDDILPNVKQLALELEVLRRFIKRPIVIVSGWRSPQHNARVKGAALSQHMTGRAADLRVYGMAPDEVHAVIESLILRGRMQDGGLAAYRSWVHYDWWKARRWNVTPPP